MKISELFGLYESQEFFSYSMSGEDANRIMQGIWKSKYPNVELHVEDEDTDMPIWETDEDINSKFYLTTHGNEITNHENTVSIGEAFSKSYKGIVGPYIKQCFEFLENEWKSNPGTRDLELPPRVLYLYSRDGSEGAWEHIAKSLNATVADTPNH